MIDRCEPIRAKLKEKTLIVINIIYAIQKLSIQEEPSCSLCRHDKQSKSFVCRPNEYEEETISVKDFCSPLTKIKENQLQNVCYNNVIDVCKTYKGEYKNSKHSRHSHHSRNSRHSRHSK